MDTYEVPTMKSVIQTENAPKAIGPYSQGIRVRTGELLFLSGQIPLTPAGELVGGDIESQTEQVLKNLEAVLDGRWFFFEPGSEDHGVPEEPGRFSAHECRLREILSRLYRQRDPRLRCQDCRDRWLSRLM